MDQKITYEDSSFPTPANNLQLSDFMNNVKEKIIENDRYGALVTIPKHILPCLDVVTTFLESKGWTVTHRVVHDASSTVNPYFDQLDIQM